MGILRGILILMVLTGLISCSNELDVIAPYKDIPVVYCVLNPGDTVHYLRLEKSFIGEDNAFDMARVQDSVYYPGAQAVLSRWENDVQKEQFVFEPVTGPVRDPGIFINDPNLLYRTTGKVRNNSNYRLEISIPSTGAAISASTITVNTFKVIRPEGFKKNLPLSSYENYLSIEWLSAQYARMYQIVMRFHYLEVRNPDTVRLSADWNVGHFISENGSGGELMKVEVLQRNFYQWVGNKISKPTPDVHRLAARKAIDIIFSVGGEDLYTYMQVTGEDSGIQKERPVFTNITNGIGIFTSRYRQSIDGKGLTDHSIDSLAYGIYTRELRFADSQNAYYLY